VREITEEVIDGKLGSDLATKDHVKINE